MHNTAMIIITLLFFGLVASEEPQHAGDAVLSVLASAGPGIDTGCIALYPGAKVITANLCGLSWQAG
jgi:hypothetical protein